MTVMQIKINMFVKIIRSETGFLASFDDLDVHAQGDSEKEAIDNFIETMAMILESCYERGTLDMVLKSAGFVADHHTPRRSGLDMVLKSAGFVAHRTPRRSGKGRPVTVTMPLITNADHRNNRLAHAG